MSKKVRNVLCGCCCRDSAAVSNDKFPLAKKDTCVSMGVQTGNPKCPQFCQPKNQQDYQNRYPQVSQQNYYNGYPQENQQSYYNGYPFENQNSYYSGYPQESRQDYYQGYQQHYPQNYQQGHVDPYTETAQYYGNQSDAEVRNLPNSVSIDSRRRYDYDASRNQNHPAMASNNNGEVGYQKRDEMRCRYDPLSSRYDPSGGDENKATREVDVDLAEKDAVDGDNDEHQGHDDNKDDNKDHKSGGHHHGKKPKGSGPAGLTRTATIMRSHQPPFLNRGPFIPNSRPYSALPFIPFPLGYNPDGIRREFGAGNNHENVHRRASFPGRLNNQPMLQTRGRRRNSSIPFPRPPVTTYAIPRASHSEYPFNSLPRDHPRDIWQNNNAQSYLFGFGKKKAAKNSGDRSNKLKMLYQINNAGVTCNCGQRVQFNLSVEENEGRCVACFEELRQDFADLLDLYKEMGYNQCECKGKISVTDLANEYLMDQANNASGLEYGQVGAPRAKAPVKTIELTPTEGFTGCLCREIKMEMYRKPSDLLSCQCDADRPVIVLRPPSEDDDDDYYHDDDDYDDDYDDESVAEDVEQPEQLSEPESEVDTDSGPASRSDSSLKTPTSGSTATVVSVAIRGSHASPFVKRLKPIPPSTSAKQSNSSNTASYETASSDTSVRSNKTYIISEP